VGQANKFAYYQKMRMKLHTFIVLAGLAGLIVAGCSKDGIETKPKLTFKSVTTDHVLYNQDIAFFFEFSDKEGDLNDSIHVIKVSSSWCETPSFADSSKWRMPNLPGTKNTKGELEIRMSYQRDLAAIPCDGVDTVETAIFKFVIKDRAGNVSDTAYSPPITIEKN
jgi:hypothetical protein